MKLNIGENIKRHRLAKELTQEQLAEELGVSPQTVSRWEGCSSYPDVELLPEIAGYFDISVDALIGADIVRQQAHLKAGIRMIHEEKDPEKRMFPDPRTGSGTHRPGFHRRTAQGRRSRLAGRTDGGDVFVFRSIGHLRFDSGIV